MRTSALISPERKAAGNGVKLQIVTNDQSLLYKELKGVLTLELTNAKQRGGKNDYHHLQNIVWNCLVSLRLLLLLV